MNMTERSSIISVAGIEFRGLIKEPLLWLVGLLILLIALVHAAGYTSVLPRFVDGTSEVFINVAMGNSFWYTTLFCSFLAVCIGVISISEERIRGTLNVLLTKPIYRRDLVAGKFLGASIFLLIAVSITNIICIVTSLIVFNGPISFYELAIRMTSYDIILFLYCVLTLGIAMLIGTFFKELALSLVLAFSYVYFAWIECFYFFDFKGLIFNLRFVDPYLLYNSIIVSVDDIRIYDTSVPYMTWFNSVSLYISLLLLEIFVIFLLNCIAFNKEEA
jgi:ABC-2 type transport system permease protein